jgi:MFS family permease
MDHAGAVGGPIAAAAFLYLMPGHVVLWQHGGAAAGPAEMYALRWLFALAALPGLAAAFTLWRLVWEKPRRVPEREAPGRKARPVRKRSLPPGFFLFLIAVLIFTLGNSSDLFLIFYGQARFGLGLGWMLFLWVLLHLSKIAFSLPGGWLADHLGRRTAITAGWSVYALVYFVIPFSPNAWALCSLLFLYGLYYGLTEGAERALVADFVGHEDRGRAYGWYHGAVGLATLPASLMFGVFWAKLGPKTAFFIGALLAAAAIFLLVLSGLSKRTTSGRM